MDIDAQNNHFKRTKVLAEQTRGPHLTILLMGKNSVSNARATPASLTTENRSVDGSKQNNIEIVGYNRIINGIPCQIIDPSCLYAILCETTLEQACIEEIRAKIT